MRSRYLIPLSVAAVGALAVPAIAGSGSLAASRPTTKQSLTAVRPALVTPFKTFHTSASRGTTIGISTGGNIIQFTSPDTGGAQYEHIGVGAFSEGYVLCYNPAAPAAKAYDTGDSSFGFNAPIASGSTVTRTTTDGKVQFKQTFTFGTGPGATNFIIKMDVKNLTGAPLTGVILRRQVDFDIDTGGSSGWAGFNSTHARTKAAVMAFHDPSEAPALKESHGIMLRTIANTGGSATSVVTADILDNTCSPAAATKVPPPPGDLKFTIYRGDFGDSMSYPVGTIPGHATKSVSVGYLRY